MKKFSSPALLLVLLSKVWFIFIIGILPWTSNHSILSSLRKMFSVIFDISVVVNFERVRECFLFFFFFVMSTFIFFVIRCKV